METVGFGWERGRAWGDTGGKGRGGCVGRRLQRYVLLLLRLGDVDVGGGGGGGDASISLKGKFADMSGR